MPMIEAQQIISNPQVNSTSIVKELARMRVCQSNMESVIDYYCKWNLSKKENTKIEHDSLTQNYHHLFS